MSARDLAHVSWEHHKYEEVGDDDSLSIRKMCEIAFKDGWDVAGGDGRLAAIDRLQELVHECSCTVPEPGGDLCWSCLAFNTIRKLLGDEADE